MKKFLLLVLYVGTVQLALIFVILYTLYTLHNDSNSQKNSLKFNQVAANYQALPEEQATQSVEVESEDGRIAALRDFFKRYNSPLETHADKIVEEADKHDIDYRLLPAIAMQESNLCKKIPKNSYNCWGFGIYSDKITRFDSYEEAIETVSKTLAQKYIAQGYQEPHEIMKKYTPGSNGSWADSVEFFMGRIDELL